MQRNHIYVYLSRYIRDVAHLSNLNTSVFAKCFENVHQRRLILTHLSSPPS